MSAISAMRCGRRLVVRCGRELSSETGGLIEQLARAQNAGARFVVLDLSAASYADSSGLRWLLAFRQALEERGAALHLVTGDKSRVTRALALTGYAQFLHLHATARAAWKDSSRAIRRTSLPASVA